MTKAEHIAAADQLLSLCSDTSMDSETRAAYATMALAHAQLAAVTT